MTIVFILFASVIIGTLLGATIAKRQNALDASKTKKVQDGKPDYELIAKLEAEEKFGVGIEINELPGCIWHLERGVIYRSLSGEKFDHNGFKVELLDANSNSLQSANVYSFVKNLYRASSRHATFTDRTIEQIENGIQVIMKELVQKEINKRKYDAGMAKILETYNGKDVEV